MTWLILGLALWVLAHLFKRLSPSLRVGLDQRLGDGPPRGLVSLLILAGLILMVWGYWIAPVYPVYSPPPGIGHLNNLLMYAAVVVFGFGMSKGVMWTRVRHPMLWGVTLWAVAHVLVNGDAASILLFGGLGAWAILEMVLINRAEGAWTRPHPGSARRDAVLLVIAAGVYGVLAGLHLALGRNPFLGTYG